MNKHVKALTELMTCIFCSNKQFTLIAPQVRDSKTHKIVKCKHCSLVQLSPTPTAKEDQKFYDGGRQFKNIAEPTQIKKLEANQRSDTRRRARLVGGLLRPKSAVLDIGSGFGFFLEAMRKVGLRPEGLEVSRFARAISKKVTPAKVHDIDLLSQTLNKKFDAITLFHVVEHIAQPVEFLRRVSQMLKKSGKLVIEVPSLDDSLLAVCPPYRAFYWQRAHLAYYNARALQKVLKRTGLKVKKLFYVQRYSLQNLMQWMIKGEPQLQKPTFISESYDWLETFYKKQLSKRKQTDTLIIIARLP